jgi:hypothetical protein
MRNTLVLLFSLFLFSVAQAQTRMEIPADNGANSFRLINLNEKGVIILQKDPQGWLNIKKYDSDLALAWESNAEIGQKSDFLEHYADGGFLYLLMENRSSKEFDLLRISVSFAATQRFPLRSVPQFDMSHFKVKDDVACVGGSVKGEPILLFYELGNQIPKIISTNLKGESGLQTIDFENDMIHVSFLNKVKKKSEAILRTYSGNGKVLYTTTITPKPEFDFLSSKFFRTAESNLIIGNYGYKMTERDGGTNSQGIYVARITDNHAPQVNYYSFADFKNFFKFMSEKQQDKIEKQVAKKKERGSEFRTSYRAHIHDLIEGDNEIIIASEVFMPEFRSNNMMSPMYGNSFMYPYSYYGRYPFYNNVWNYYPNLWGYGNRGSQILDGFKYIQGLIISIDKSGKLKWDNSIPYKNLKMYDLKNYIKVTTKQGSTLAAYSRDNKIVVNEFSETGQLKDGQVIDEPNERTQRPRNGDYEDTEYWFGNYFLNWGVQKVTDAGGRKKTVFFVNKIPY